MFSRNRICSLLVVLTMGLAAAACSGKGGVASSGTSAPPPSATAGPTAPGPAATVPITMGHQGSSPYRPMVMVSVGGGPAVPVHLDTGSSGLVLAASAVGSGIRDTGRTSSVHYGSPDAGNTLNYRVADAVVTFPGTGIATPAPVAVGVIDQDAADAKAFQSLSGDSGAQGTLGIALGGPKPESKELMSVITQLGAPNSDGYTVALTPTGGTLTLGAPKATASSVVLPLTKADGTYADGRQAWQRLVNLCWQVGQAHSCGPTTIDTGAPAQTFSVLHAQGDVPQTNGLITQGTRVTLAAPDGGPVLEAVTTGSGSSPDTTATRVNSITDQSNSGVRFFLVNAVGFNRITGQAVITPTAAR
ncbi:hypothetical protein LN042_30010 [Kitasatospora sp. RB6PN24]|uniref:hypothetical protein n=1 Tax=Kitasatospora humi TaxID=2893891 RepID=UPI001E459742|nr:hypothetical protein [Kitasatospora humi]MCC9311245.1 hypothetical protein [Kitasatospora humi]